MMTGKTLFAFVDPKDPFMPTEVAEEQGLGPILSITSARPFDFLFLFHTPHTRENAKQTRRQLKRRHPECKVVLRELPVSDPKDYSSLMGSLARQVQQIVRQFPDPENFVSVSSGTAEMRAAWFLLTAAGLLPATLLQVGSPAEPLFGPAHVKEVRLDIADWENLRDLAMPLEYFEPSGVGSRPLRRTLIQAAELDHSVSSVARGVYGSAAPYPSDSHDLDGALQELGIFVGSATFREAVEKAAIAADSDAPVLLLGETGTGKELVAKLIHRMSRRRHRVLVPINCAAIPKELAESYLFGHVKGAFTGATTEQKGKFESANGGTLFFDEIGELTLEIQAKLLRVVEDGEVEAIGSSKPRKVDVRIVAATNRDLAEEIKAGRFRNDLYYRLEVARIPLPSLRERRAEIPPLAVGLLKRINHRRQRPRQISKEALQRLQEHNWPGNVRELENVLERSVLFSRADVLGADDLLIKAEQPKTDALALLPDPRPGFSLESFLEQVRKQLFLRALEVSNGNQSSAATLLGVSKQAVNNFLKSKGSGITGRYGKGT